jgi:hypothetical protein
MSMIQYQAVRPPYDGNTPNNAPVVNGDYKVLLFSGGVKGTETTSAASALPKGWPGKYVTISAEGTAGAIVTFAFSKRSAAVVDNTVASTQVGASANVGGTLMAPGATLMMDRRRVQLPICREDEDIFFVRQSSALGINVRIELSSD